MAVELRTRRQGFWWANKQIHHIMNLSDKEFRVYCILCDHENSEKKEAWPFVARIAEMADCTRRTVQTALKNLQNKNMIEIESRSASGQSSIYTLTDVSEWHTKHRNSGLNPMKPVSQGV